MSFLHHNKVVEIVYKRLDNGIYEITVNCSVSFLRLFNEKDLVILGFSLLSDTWGLPYQKNNCRVKTYYSKNYSDCIFLLAQLTDELKRIWFNLYENEDYNMVSNNERITFIFKEVDD